MGRTNIVENICPYSSLLDVYNNKACNINNNNNNNSKEREGKKEEKEGEKKAGKSRSWPSCMVIAALHDERVRMSDGLKFIALYRDFLRLHQHQEQEEKEVETNIDIRKTKNNNSNHNNNNSGNSNHNNKDMYIEMETEREMESVGTSLLLEREGGHEGPPSLEQRIDTSAKE